jgi:hypothetical protein
MSISDYEACNRKVIAYIQKNDTLDNNLPAIICYLTLNLGYTPARQKLILKAVGFNRKIEKVQEYILDCVTDYNNRRKEKLLSFTKFRKTA